MAIRKAARRRAARQDDGVLKDLLVLQLQDLYDADRQLVSVFAQLARAAQAKPVVTLCREGVSYTNERVRRLERVFSLLDRAARGRRSDGMRGLIRHALRHPRPTRQSSIATDAGIMAAVQQISFYGLSGYSTACLLAARARSKA